MPVLSSWMTNCHRATSANWRKPLARTLKCWIAQLSSSISLPNMPRLHEGKLQVELAQLEYRLPRLTRMWTHLARQAGGRAGGASGGVGLRGPGETQLEVDRREIGRRISHIKSELDTVRARRGRHRSKRQQTELQVVAIVGYTNAGKSTLLNKLSGADVLTADMLFATFDPTTRKVSMPGGREVLFTDTVGFIQKLPTEIVAAFRATLEEIADADMLLHVVDATHPNAPGSDRSGRGYAGRVGGRPSAHGCCIEQGRPVAGRPRR